jgi:hypothetical protein
MNLYTSFCQNHKTVYVDVISLSFSLVLLQFCGGGDPVVQCLCRAGPGCARHPPCRVRAQTAGLPAALRSVARQTLDSVCKLFDIPCKPFPELHKTTEVSRCIEKQTNLVSIKGARCHYCVALAILDSEIDY